MDRKLIIFHKENIIVTYNYNKHKTQQQKQ